MTNPVSDAKKSIEGLVRSALEKASQAGSLPVCGELPAFVVEIPADTSHGDFATNVAMAGARAYKCAPRKVAEAICQNIALEGTAFDRVEIAGPGFINFFLGAQWYADVVKSVRARCV